MEEVNLVGIFFFFSCKHRVDVTEVVDYVNFDKRRWYSLVIKSKY